MSAESCRPRRPLARWNPARGVWETGQTALCGHSEPYSETWPTAGTTRAGAAYAQPTSERPTAATGSSSLLKTPTAQLASNGGSQHPDTRQAGGHGATLADEIEHLLPTPMASMNGASQVEIEAGNPKHRLETAVALLPTPRASDGTKGGPNQAGSAGDLTLPSAVTRLPGSSGANTPRPSTAGGPSSDAPPRIPPNQEPAAEGA